MTKIAVAAFLVLLTPAGCGREEGKATLPVHSATCDQGRPPAALLVQVKPGFNPNGITYQEDAVVSVDGRPLATKFTIRNDSGPAEGHIALDALAAGDTLLVSATFTDGTGSAPVTCEQSFPAVAAGSLGCGPIEVFYQAALGTCVLVCN